MLGIGYSGGILVRVLDYRVRRVSKFIDEREFLMEVRVIVFLIKWLKGKLVILI